MPDGTTHHAYHKAAAIPFAAAVSVVSAYAGLVLYRLGGLYNAGYAIEFWFWSNFWYLSGRWFDPDLDGLGISSAEGRMLRELKLVGALLYGYFSLYAGLMYWLAGVLKLKGLFGSHRSALTHSPIGTAIRILFLDAPLALLYLGAHQLFNVQFSNGDLLVFLLSQFIGLGSADGVHVFLDVMEEKLKRT